MYYFSEKQNKIQENWPAKQITQDLSSKFHIPANISWNDHKFRIFWWVNNNVPCHLFHSLVLGFDVCTIWSGNIMQFYIFLFSKTWNFLWIVYLIFDNIFQLGLCEHICPCHAIYVDTRICMNWCSPPTILVLWIKLKLSGIERRKYLVTPIFI